jgi:hypothetical protein
MSASAWKLDCIRADVLTRPRTVKTRLWVKSRPQDKCGGGQTSGRNGRPDGNFYRRSSIMTTLV